MEEKEFGYTDNHFKFLQKKAFELAGIDLADTKTEMIYSRISRLIREMDLHSFDEYCNYLKAFPEKANTKFINTITTNLTSFFREMHHFSYLTETVFPHILTKKSIDKKIRIWSAGCSTGEEPYSLSFVARDFFQGKDGWDVKILATDIDKDALAVAKKGIYSSDIVAKLPPEQINRYFKCINSNSQNEKQYEVKNFYRDIITFNHLNLHDNDWPMRFAFDVIFCRNVIIYFTREMQIALIEKFVKLIQLKGYLMLGHSESIPPTLSNLKPIGKTIYQRIK